MFDCSMLEKQNLRCASPCWEVEDFKFDLNKNFNILFVTATKKKSLAVLYVSAWCPLGHISRGLLNHLQLFYRSLAVGKTNGNVIKIFLCLVRPTPLLLKSTISQSRWLQICHGESHMKREVHQQTETVVTLLLLYAAILRHTVWNGRPCSGSIQYKETKSWSHGTSNIQVLAKKLEYFGKLL